MGWGNNSCQVERGNKMTPPKLRKSPGSTQCLLFNLNPCSWCSITRRCKLLRCKLFGGARAGARAAWCLPGEPGAVTVVGWGSSGTAVTDLHGHQQPERLFCKRTSLLVLGVVLHEDTKAAGSVGGAAHPGKACASCRARSPALSFHHPGHVCTVFHFKQANSVSFTQM